MPATKVATVTREVDQQGLVAHLTQSQLSIARYLRDAGAAPAEGYTALYHGFVTPDSEAPVEVCVEFSGTDVAPT